MQEKELRKKWFAKLSVLRLIFTFMAILLLTPQLIAFLCALGAAVLKKPWVRINEMEGVISLGLAIFLQIIWQNRLLGKCEIGWRELFLAAETRLIDKKRLLLFLPLFFLAGWGLTLLNAELLNLLGMKQASPTFNAKLNFLSGLLQFFVIVLLAPLSEEIFFRGLILHRLVTVMNIRKALLVSSLIFAIIHFDGQLLPRFFLGLSAGVLYLFSGNLKYSLFLHVFQNGAVFLQWFFELKPKGDIAITELTIGAITMVFALCFCAKFLRDYWPRSEEEAPLYKTSGSK